MNKLDKLAGFIERHKVAVNVVCWGSVAAMVAAPTVREEVLRYRHMQAAICDIETLLGNIATDLGTIRDI